MNDLKKVLAISDHILKRKTNAWDVLLKGKVIDTVFFIRKMGEEEVREALINHDDFDPSIKVERN